MIINFFAVTGFLLIFAVAVINVAVFIFAAVEAARAIQHRPTKIAVDREVVAPVGICRQRFIDA